MVRPILVLVLVLAACRAEQPAPDTQVTQSHSGTVTTADSSSSVSTVDDDGDDDGYDADEDCDDTDATVYPGAEEICDGLDNDCDQEIDEGVLMEIWPDADEDGFGDALATPFFACEPAAQEADRGDDCDDRDSDVHPEAPEQCNSGIDEDCDPTTQCDGSCLPEIDFTLCGNPALPSPKLHWSYDNLTDSQVVDDGWAALDGTFVGAPTFGPGLIGDAAFFDGNSWIEAAANLNLPGDTWTFVTWVRAHGADNTGSFHFLMSNGNGTPAYSGANLYLQEGLMLSAYTESGGNPVDECLFDGEDICDDSWSQVALTFDQGAARLWVNGTPTLTQVGYNSVGWGAHPFAVGNDPNISVRHFLGELDETRVYDSKLGATALAALRAEPFCP